MSARITLNHRVHVLTRKEELETGIADGRIVVVLDILFATTTMVTALAHGATEIIPVPDEAAARERGAALAALDPVLSGELYAETIPGFAHPAPLSLVRHGIAGRTVIYSTTNGTVAMTQCTGAARVYCGALLNARRLAEHVIARHRDQPILIVCSGSGANFNLEDFYGAGYFVERIAELLGPRADLSDAALVARTLYRSTRSPQVLLDCRVGRIMSARGLAEEVEFAARFDAFPIIAEHVDGRVRRLAVDHDR